MKASELIKQIIDHTQGDLNQEVVVRVVYRQLLSGNVIKAEEMSLNGLTLGKDANTIAIRVEDSTRKDVT